MTKRALAVSFLMLMCTCWSFGQEHANTPQAVERALTDGQSFAEAGKYAQALDRYLWYYKNSRDVPGQGGVRLSFALSYWVELGQKYPKALVALRHVRDEALDTYRKAPTDEMKLREVMSIDGYLHDWAHMKKTFYEARRHHVDDSGLILNLDEILAIPDRAWARDILGTPMASLDKIKKERDLQVWADKMSGQKDKYVKEIDDLHADEILKIISAVDRVYGRADALKVQKAALQILNRPDIRNALR